MVQCRNCLGIVPACYYFTAIVMSLCTGSARLLLPPAPGWDFLSPIHLPELGVPEKNILGLGFQLKANSNGDPEYLDLNKEALIMLIKALTS